MKHKLLIALLSIALVPCTSFAKKPSQKIPQPGQAVYVDANGTMLGDVQTNVGGPDDARIYFEVNEKFYVTAYNSEGLIAYNELYYDKSDCTGNVYIRETEKFDGVEFLQGSRESVFYLENSDIPQTVEVLSSWSDRGYECFRFGDVICDEPPPFRFHCLNVLDFQPEPGVVDNVYPAVPLIDTNIYTPPFRLKLTPPN